jgi:hypothetical protein
MQQKKQDCCNRQKFCGALARHCGYTATALMNTVR